MLISMVPALLLGMLIPLLQPNLFSYWVLVFIATGAILLIWLSQIIKCYRALVIFIAVILLSLIWFTCNAHWSLAQQLPQVLENMPLVVQGEINSLPVNSNDQLQFQLKIQRLCQKNQCHSWPLEAALTWRNAPANLAIGQWWQLQVKLKQPHGYANPGSFDREAYLLENGVRATGYVMVPYSFNTSHAVNHLNQLLLPATSLSAYLANIRLRYDRYILTHLNNLPFAGVIDALTVGNSASISSTQWQIFRNTGTTHLIAISGLHIGMIAALFYVIGKWLWRRSARLCELLPAQKAAAFFSIFGAFGYTAFSGFSIPAQRTLIMIIAWEISILLNRFSLPFHRFMLGLGLVLLINPFAIMNMGFWLSFGAIALIGYGMNARLAPKSLWWRFGRVQWVATIGLMPLSWLLFQQTSIVGLLANMIAIPWVGWITVPIALLGCIIAPFNHLAGDWLLWLAEKTLEWLWPYLHYLANLRWNSWFLGFNNPWLILPSMMAVLLLLAPTRFPTQWLAIFWLLPAVMVKPEKLPIHAVKISALDVGQGLSIVIQTRSHTALYDTGIGYPDGYNMGDVVILPFFRQQHIYQLNQLIISHGDADHAGGAIAILQQFPQLPVLTSAINQFKAYSVQRCRAGQHWQWDGVEFNILYPFPQQKLTDNNSSCVLQIIAGDKTVLLPGDIEKPAESALVNRYHAYLRADVLVAPHHGSKSSSTPMFLQAVKPELTIFATGYLNRYRFPSAQVVTRYKNIGSQAFNLAYDGAVTLILIPGQPIQVHQYRQEHRHFWNTGQSRDDTIIRRGQETSI